MLSVPASAGAYILRATCRHQHSRFKDIIDKVTVHEEVDEITGLSRPIIIDSPDEKKQPAIEIVAADGRTLVVVEPPEVGQLGQGRRQQPPR